MMKREEIHIGIVGLGYVGLPLATLFASRYPTVGYDCNSLRVTELAKANDSTCEVDAATLQKALQSGRLTLVDKPEALKECNVYIVAVPTPVDCNNHPDLMPLIGASQTVGALLNKGDVVIYESTVYPGVTEDECVPQLVAASGLKYNTDFFVGYSPERVNPSDTEHTVETIIKVTSGSTPETADFVDELYNSVLRNGTHKAPSIRVAEASKIVENCQRDVNIAFINELAKIFAAMGIDTNDVLAAAATKWNFIKMKPGLVGGHCISVDPYYLIEKAQVYGVLPRVMYSARRLNDSMGAYVAGQVVKQMNLKGVPVKDAKILILGFAFKENCPDTRNTKVADIYNSLKEYTPNIAVCDDWVDAERVRKEYGIEIKKTENINQDIRYDAAILAVAHRQFADIDLRRLVPEPGVVYDVKGVLPRHQIDARL